MGACTSGPPLPCLVPGCKETAVWGQNFCILHGGAHRPRDPHDRHLRCRVLGCNGIAIKIPGDVYGLCILHAEPFFEKKREQYFAPLRMEADSQRLATLNAVQTMITAAAQNQQAPFPLGAPPLYQQMQGPNMMQQQQQQYLKQQFSPPLDYSHPPPQLSISSASASPSANNSNNVVYDKLGDVTVIPAVAKA